MRTGKTINGLLVVLVLLFSPGIMNAQTGITISGGPDWPGGAFGPEKAVDHNPETYWAGKPEADAWQLILDMNAETELKTVTVVYYSSEYMPKTATVYTSVDGKMWNEAGVLPLQTPATIAINRKSRYMKLDMQGKASGKQPAIYEIKFNDKTEKQDEKKASSSR